MRINRRERWQDLLSQATLPFKDLLNRLQLPLDLLTPAEQLFPLRVPAPYLNRIKAGDPSDPLLRQILPSAEEFNTPAHFRHDPLEESTFSPLPGLLHKYKSRALLMVSGGCAINCRYCFRRHFPYTSHAISSDRWQAIRTYLLDHPEITEIIISGGDPLLLKDGALMNLFTQLGSIPSLRRLRVHTRIPVVLPQRMTANCWRTLGDSPLPLTIVLHVNHAQELDWEVAEAIKPARALGITLLNQAVLLAGVNDDVAIQAALSEALFDMGVLPYYLHLLDPVSGAAHFDVREDKAIEIMQGLLSELPGYLVPRLVREIPNEAHKTPIAISAVRV